MEVHHRYKEVMKNPGQDQSPLDFSLSQHSPHGENEKGAMQGETKVHHALPMALQMPDL